jgi:hypothetical protein
MPLATVRYVDPTPIYGRDGHRQKHWSKVEGPFQSFALLDRHRAIEDISGREAEFNIDDCGFSFHHWPVRQDVFANDHRVREDYHPQVEELLRKKLSGVKHVTIFDHTLRQMEADSLRKPVMQVHVDQTAGAAEARVRRHTPPEQTEKLLQSRYSVINVWRPIGHPALEYPLAVVDWRTLSSKEFVPVDLLYPIRDPEESEDDDRGLEAILESSTLHSTNGYEVKGETYGIAPSAAHRFYYKKNMTPDETVLFKCADSKGSGLPDGSNSMASCCPHTAFNDPETPINAPSRRSIEVRCLVFFE